jgi:tight adherence protein C
MVDFLLANDIARWLFLGVVFAAMMMIVFTVIGSMNRRSAVRAELKTLETRGPGGQVARLSHAKQTAWTRLADRIERTGLNLTDTKSDAVRQKLIAAGFDSSAAPRLFTLIRLVLIFALPGVFVLLTLAGGSQMSFLKMYLYSAVLALVGLYLPNLFVTARADRRREQITNGFPDCLDLLLVCVEAGLSLEAALDRVGREMIESHPLVARILSTTTLQLRAGAQSDAALRSMGEISGVDEIKSFATLLIQSDKLGTSMASTLRVYSAEMREKRRMRAEEKAHRLPVIISIPLVVNMLPTMIGVLMLPAVVRVVRTLIPALTGG